MKKRKIGKKSKNFGHWLKRSFLKEMDRLKIATINSFLSQVAKVSGARHSFFTLIDNSSENSLINASSGLSPEIILPPGNSHLPASHLLLGLFAINIFSSS